MAAALATGLAEFGPDWGAGAPARPLRPVTLAVPQIIPAPPRVIQYPASLRQEWLSFKQRFVSREGRVVDTGNGNASHSEGQGWGLMAAQAANDPEGFATILTWTQQNLQRRPSDPLHAWRYRPGDPNPVSDLNNATDGDLFIAGALARAAMRWNRPEYAAAAARIGRAIIGLTRQAGPRTVLLPGAAGFEKSGTLTLNPSYYTFALFADLAAVTPSPVWDKLRQDGLALVMEGRFGRWMLPPDWLQADLNTGALSISAGWPPRFSYDAIRAPLHLAWANLPAAPVQDAFRRYWLNGHASPPAWVDLRTQEVAGYDAPAGFHAVASVALQSATEKTGAFPSVAAAKDYYSAGLILLSRLAAGESGLMA
jgi:endoglucanase